MNLNVLLRRMRVALAVIVWMSLTLLFLDVTGVAGLYLGWLAKLQFLPAIMAVNVGAVVLVVVMTLLVGRLYCSVLCPLGITSDLFNWLTNRVLPKKIRKMGRYHYYGGKKQQVVRYTILFLFILLLLMGMTSITRFLAPYSMFGRFVTILLKPFWVEGNNYLADWAAANDNYDFVHVQNIIPSLSMIVVSTVSMGVVMLFSIFGGRSYCNDICPVGTLLGLIGRRRIVGIHIDAEKCRHCGLCEHKCKAHAINSAEAAVDATRCIDCFDCLDTCHVGALTFSVATKKGKAETDTTRRTLIVTAATMTAAAALKAEEKTADGGYAIIEDKKPFKRETPIVPPGALSLKNMNQHCTGCQLCVSACPNHVLRPSTDLSDFMQPVMSYENGYCRPECHACSDVCPAGAIFKLGSSHEEKMAVKSSTKIGRAVWIKENCLPAAEGTKCGNCARHCPSGAISMVPSDPSNPRSVQIPVVNEERCIGCGACENLCPVRPFSAIHVEGIEVQRTI